MSIQSTARAAYLGAAVLGATTLAVLVLWYPWEDVQESIGKLVATTALVAGALCLLASFWRKPVVPVACVAIIIGAAGVGWEAGFTPLPPPPRGIVGSGDDLSMVTGGICAGGAIGLVFALLVRTGLKRLMHTLFGLVNVVLAAAATVVLWNIAPTAWRYTDLLN